MATFKHIKFGDGLSVTDEGAGVITVAAGASASTPPDATTSSKGIVQLAGDLAGTAASPQIAAGAIIDADVAAANKDGTAATPSLRTLGTGAQQAAAGNDSRFLKAAVAYGTSLPGSPVDGQEAILVDSTTNPLYQWRFRYNAGSSSAYKWEFIGGSPLIGTFTTQQGISAGAWTVGEPTLTAPRTGEYLVTLRGVAIPTSTVPAQMYIALSINASTTPVTNSPQAIVGTVVNGEGTINGADIPVTLTSGDTLKHLYLSTVAGGAFSFRNLFMRPSRVS